MKPYRLLDNKMQILLVLCAIVAFSSCSKDDDKGDSDSKEVWYASQSRMNSIKLSQTAFAEIEKAIDNHELLEKTYVSNGNYLNRYAERSSFVASDGGFKTYDKVGRLKNTIDGMLDVIKIIDESTLSYCHFNLYVDEDVQDKSMKKVATLFRGHIFKSVSVYLVSETYYTYAKVANKLVLLDGTIYIETSQGLIQDGTSELMVKMNPYKIFVVSNDSGGNGKEENADKTGTAPATAEAVDLGLSVKWANMNVGANTPEEYGDYFAWGETKPKVSYDWSTYFDSVDASYTNFNKYALDKKTKLDLKDDAAHVNWGGTWRMPTKAEQDELIKNCTWTWTTQNGVKGHKVTSKSNGNSIFLPAAGYREDSNLDGAGACGYYWSSSLDASEDSDYAYSLYYKKMGDYGWSNDYRYYGQSVRAVCP